MHPSIFGRAHDKRGLVHCKGTWSDEGGEGRAMAPDKGRLRGGVGVGVGVWVRMGVLVVGSR